MSGPSLIASPELSMDIVGDPDERTVLPLTYDRSANKMLTCLELEVSRLQLGKYTLWVILLPHSF